MMTLAQQAARLQEEIRTISPAEARRRINDAYIRNSERHPWQHRLKRFTLQTEAEYNTGTIDITTLTSAVTLSGGAWVVAWGTVPSHRRMALQGRPEPYDVTVFGSTTTATLADTYPGDTIDDGTYNLLRDTYPLPTDCGYAKLMALYDVQQRSGDYGRLWFFQQPRFLQERMLNPTLTGVPYCFSLVGQTTESTPRPQIMLYPAPSEVIVYHGWFFSRPAELAAESDRPDWPAEFQDMHWLQAAIDYYRQPLHFSRRFIDQYSEMFANLFRKMKQEMDGQNAMENEISGTRSGRTGFNPTFAGSTVTGSISWE